MLTRFNPLIKVRCRLALRAQGKGFFEINGIMDGWDDSLVSTAASLLPPEHASEFAALQSSFSPEDGKFGAIGDGTIINAILDFLKSPAGQALIALIIKLLTGL